MTSWFAEEQVAKVAKVIGEDGVNIGSMNVVQKNDKHEVESIMVINIQKLLFISNGCHIVPELFSVFSIFSFCIRVCSQNESR